MKTTHCKCFFLIVTVMLSMFSCSQDLKKVPENAADHSRIQIAQKFAEAYMEKSKEGTFYTFGDEVTETLKNLLTKENQQSLYQQLISQFGDYLSLAYAETWKQKSSPDMLIVRFKASFSNSVKVLEVRVVLDAQNKIAGFWIKPWNDLLA
jgi:hypothetical protein